MKRILMLLCFFSCLSNYAFSQNVTDSVLIDKKKMEEAIGKIKERREFKNPDMKDVTFSFPKKISEKDQWIILVAKRKGEDIIYYGLDARTYELTGEIIDLRE